MLALPSNANDPIDLADWLELSAFEAGDGNISVSDLISTLRILSDNDKAESLSLEVMLEIEQRAKSAGEAYPFLIQNLRVLQCKDNWQTYAAYIFCLCLSFFGWKSTSDSSVNPWYLFEELSCLAAKAYVRGEVYRFGADAKIGNVPFKTRVNKLCFHLKEGRGFLEQSTLKRKDDKVDLVAWKDFQDGHESKLVMFGQCAAGANWQDKSTELQPDAFWDQWIDGSKVSPLIRSFYIPFRINREIFIHTSRRAGILFDRCRIAHSVWSNNDTIVADSRYNTWCKLVFPALV